MKHLSIIPRADPAISPREALARDVAAILERNPDVPASSGEQRRTVRVTRLVLVTGTVAGVAAAVLLSLGPIGGQPFGPVRQASGTAPTASPPRERSPATAPPQAAPVVVAASGATGERSAAPAHLRPATHRRAPLLAFAAIAPDLPARTVAAVPDAAVEWSPAPATAAPAPSPVPDHLQVMAAAAATAPLAVAAAADRGGEVSPVSDRKIDVAGKRRTDPRRVAAIDALRGLRRQ